MTRGAPLYSIWSLAGRNTRRVVCWAREVRVTEHRTAPLRDGWTLEIEVLEPGEGRNDTPATNPRSPGSGREKIGCRSHRCGRANGCQDALKRSAPEQVRIVAARTDQSPPMLQRRKRC